MLFVFGLSSVFRRRAAIAWCRASFLFLPRKVNCFPLPPCFGIGGLQIQNLFSPRRCRGESSLRRAERALAPTKRGVPPRAECDKREFLPAKQGFAGKQKKSCPCKILCWDRTDNHPAVPPGLTRRTRPLLRILTYADLCSRRVQLRLAYSGDLPFRSPSEVHSAPAFLPRSHLPRLSERKGMKPTHSSSTVYLSKTYFLFSVKRRFRICGF